jgi:hypothetical protein
MLGGEDADHIHALVGYAAMFRNRQKDPGRTFRPLRRRPQRTRLVSNGSDERINVSIYVLNCIPKRVVSKSSQKRLDI